jgi:hypothetical protein
MHSDAAVAPLRRTVYVPAWHRVQCVALCVGAYAPPWHGWQLVKAGAAEYEPRWHRLQATDDVAPIDVAYASARHTVHAEAAVCAMNVPA